MYDFRLAIRMMRRQPLTSLLAIVALALGIGLTTLMFSILNGAVLRGLPFEQSDRLLHIAPFDIKDDDDFEATQWEFSEWRARQHSFEDLAGLYVGNANVVGPDGTPERYRAAWITPNSFALLRARPQIMFFQVSPYDPRVFAAVAALLFVTGLAAAFVPARRAARVDPMSALRAQ